MTLIDVAIQSIYDSDEEEEMDDEPNYAEEWIKDPFDQNDVGQIYRCDPNGVYPDVYVRLTHPLFPRKDPKIGRILTIMVDTSAVAMEEFYKKECEMEVPKGSLSDMIEKERKPSTFTGSHNSDTSLPQTSLRSDLETSSSHVICMVVVLQRTIRFRYLSVGSKQWCMSRYKDRQ